MSHKIAAELIEDFREHYDAEAKDAIWQDQSQAFRDFWKNRILAPGEDPLSDDECDAIVKILDRNGKGNTADSESVARAMTPQKAWRRMFNEFRTNRQLGKLVLSIMEEPSPDKKADLIDQLYEENKSRKNRLTGPSGNVISAFLAAHDPVNNLSMISLNDRKALFKLLGLDVPFDWEKKSIGQCIVKSNMILMDALRAAGIGSSASARTLTAFCYWDGMQDIWKNASESTKDISKSPWWKRFFESEKQGNAAFDFFREVCEAVGVTDTKGASAKRVSFTNIKEKGQELLRLNCANILVFQLGTLESGKPNASFVMRLSDKQGKYVPSGRFSNSFNGHELGHFQVYLSELLEDGSIARKLFFSALGDVSNTYKNIKKRNFEDAHRPRLLYAAFHEDRRADMLANGPTRKPSDEELDPKPEPTGTDGKQDSVKNLILYGPPGTGKTYSTIDRALEIIDPRIVESTKGEKDGRAKRKARFDELHQAKRIGFVTFHQSFSYEDFVEGLKASTDESGQVKYEVEDGIFKQMCSTAAASSGGKRTGPAKKVDPAGRTIWKMSLGNTLGPDAAIYDECLENGYVLLGWGQDIDFTGASTRDDIKAKVKDGNPEGSDSDYTVTACHAFVNTMKPGDLIIVSDGNHKFRAIGVVKGDYRFLPVEEDRELLYQQCRDVEWIRTYAPSLPNDQLMTVAFSQATIYCLKPPAIDLDLVRSLLNEDGSTADDGPRSFVLIIDEINRGNISRVFGELITLIEESKRTGNSEALSVKLPYSKDMFSVPSNLYLIGTMNTADRSLAQLDIALRRRFVFEEFMPDPAILSNLPIIDGIRVDQMLTEMNRRIEVLYDREHTIGHTFFLSLNDNPSLAEMQRIFSGRILPLLEEYFFEDWEKIRLVLGDHQKPPALAMIKPKYSDADLETLFGADPRHTINTVYQRNEEALGIPESYIGIYDPSVNNGKSASAPPL